MDIDNGIPVPPEPTTKVCTDCNLSKPETEFSLKRGKHSRERKPYCVKCEYNRSKFGKSKETIFAEQAQMLLLPCSICGHQSQKRKIDYSTSSRPLGVICIDCDKVLKRLVIDPSLIMRFTNYLTLKNNFPGLATKALYAMIGQRQNDTPLLDNIE